MRRVLLVEDNEFNRDMLSRRLERSAWQVVVALDGLEGVQLARGEKPDLILMDLSMPVLSGWDAVRAIREFPELAETPIIALSAHAMAEDRESALAAGCNGFAAKPVQFEQLIALMESLGKE